MCMKERGVKPTDSPLDERAAALQGDSAAGSASARGTGFMQLHIQVTHSHTHKVRTVDDFLNCVTLAAGCEKVNTTQFM